MADIEHNSITDPNRHEPKGIDTGTAGQVYAATGGGTDGGSWVDVVPAGADVALDGQVFVSDGAGSGSWSDELNPSYVCMRRTTDVTTSGISGTYQAINQANLGVTWTSSTNSTDFTPDFADGSITVANDGVYKLACSVSLQGTVSGDRHYVFALGIDEGAGSGIVTSDIVRAFRSTDNANDGGSASLICLPTLSSGDKVYLMLKVDSGGTSEILIRHINFTFVRVK